MSLGFIPRQRYALLFRRTTLLPKKLKISRRQWAVMINYRTFVPDCLSTQGGRMPPCMPPVEEYRGLKTDNDNEQQEQNRRYYVPSRLRAVPDGAAQAGDDSTLPVDDDGGIPRLAAEVVEESHQVSVPLMGDSGLGGRRNGNGRRLWRGSREGADVLSPQVPNRKDDEVRTRLEPA